MKEGGTVNRILGIILLFSTMTVMIATIRGSLPEWSRLVMFLIMFLGGGLLALKSEGHWPNLFWVGGLLVYFPGFLLMRLGLPHVFGDGSARPFYVLTGLLIGVAGVLLCAKGQKLKEEKSKEMITS